ncbi:flagellar motor protein MotB [Shimia haliotis]|uniref:Chemotaxis protein MotB n=1 Tax=Shimia haliotis TaxID=1280847 RepID=A0A1I4DEL4_9RHOB|nr:flagellar motor protein MotB [Shimia haliotis]SFK91379.1 chemotaxis protein MotB [Shimia haliotis]
MGGTCPKLLDPDMADTSNRPIIIKRKKVVINSAHHGGAWKIAYADFVTAMMAFFLLMWLINATSEEQRLGLAQYFSPTIPINRIAGGGSHMFGGKSVTEEQLLARSGRGGLPTEQSGTPGTEDSKENVTVGTSDDLAAVQDFLVGGGGESFLNDNLKKHVVTRLTDEGLVIELYDAPDDPLFAENSTSPTPIMIDLVEIIAKAAQSVANDVAIEGHVRAEPIILRESSVWDQSTGRAEAVRVLMQRFGTPKHRINRVVGHADRELVSHVPRDVRNNRIEIILLRD